MTTYKLFGPVDEILGANVTGEVVVIEIIVLGLVLVNMLARARAYRQHVSQAENGGAEAISRSPLRVATNALLVISAFYYLTLHYHAGFVTSVLVLGVVLTDVFEFESRKVEARREIEIERPKGSLVASLLALIYVGYVTFLSGPIGNLVSAGSVFLPLF